MALPRGARRASIPAVLAVAVAVGGLLAPGPADAQPLPNPIGDEEPSAPDPTDPEQRELRARAVASELADVERAIPEAPNAADRAHLEAVRDRLQTLESLLEEMAVRGAADTDSAGAARLPETSTASVFALNALYEARFAAEEADQQRESVVAASRSTLANARQGFDDAERNRRKARGELDAALPDGRVAAERALQLRELASRVAMERMHLAAIALQAAEGARGDEEQLTAIDAAIAEMRARLGRGEGKFRPGLAALSEREGALRRARESIERRLATAELRLDAAQRRFSQQPDPPNEALEEVEAMAARRDAIRQQMALTDAQLERVSAQRETWRHWSDLLANTVEDEDLADWKEAAQTRVETFAQAEVQRRARAADLRRRVDALDARLGGRAEGARTRAPLREQRDELVRLLEGQLAETAELAAEQRLTARLLDDLRDRTGEIDPLQYVRSAAGAAVDVWSYEITSVDDSPITVGSLVLALTLFVAGMWGARRGAGALGRFAARRFSVDAGASHALETLAFYVLLVSFTLLALRAVHFPLTAFTVLGGALAIGIGFGSQNVMNNFISGLILMLERPVRARDVVEVDGNYGTVEHIGARSTQIRSTDGRHIVVPNSFFLENNVVNWTLSDELIRTRVVVGVIYGSPTRLVEELIQRVVNEDDQVLKRPVPVILFAEFGDNSLNFEVHFWVTGRSPMEVRKTESRVRFRIDDLFRENGLVIAFPQRDVHLDSASPIEVRMVPAGDTPEKS